MSPSALKAFFNIVELWHVRDEEARRLLGGVSNGPYYDEEEPRRPGPRCRQAAAHLLSDRHLQGAATYLHQYAALAKDGCAFPIPTASSAG